MPVKRHVQRQVGGQIDQAALGQITLDQHFRVHAPAKAQPRGIGKGMRVGDAVHGQRQPSARQRLRPPALQRVLGVEAQRRGLDQAGGCHAIREMAGGEIRAGGRAIAQHAQPQTVAARHRAAVAGDRGRDQAAAQPIERMVLVVDGQIHKSRRSGQGGHHPGRQAVGVHRQTQHRQARRQSRQTGFQQPNLIQMRGQSQALRRGPDWWSTIQKNPAHPILERADPLGNRRGRHAQGGGCGIKGTAADDLGQGGNGGIVQH